NQLSETIGNLGLFTGLGIPTTGTSLETHQMVRFLFGFLCFFEFLCRVTNSRGVGCFYFNQWLQFHPFPPHDPKTPKTVMQSVMRCGIIFGK
ncbi:MAG: hypothetical protein UIH99_02625, partial [Alphaproteobacteria bacterium]|nr:hypothetical protein [Alphaproteobacteria bacterium]